MSTSTEERYSRQILFSPLGQSGQEQLSKAHALIIGAGALGTPLADTLVRAGVGKITLVDRDYVEWSNLQRQTLYVEEDAVQRIPKAIAAKRHLQKVNSAVEIEAHVADVTPQEITYLAHNVDLIIDATDNFEIRMLMNDFSQKNNIPWIYGACVGSYGVSCFFLPGKTPCLHCLLDTIPIGGATCDTVGIIAPVVQMVSAYQAVEALKYLSGNEHALSGRMTSFDLWNNQHTSIRMQNAKKLDCPSCGPQATFPYLSQQSHSKTATLCGRNTVQIRPPQPITRDLEQLYHTLAKRGGGKIERNPFLLSYTVDEQRMVFFTDGRVFVHGTDDPSLARSLYHRLLG